MPKPTNASSELVIGWKVSKQFDPEYWVHGASVPYGHKPEDLIKVPGKAMANHAVTIAQSGSGKSFFLGRVVEEILLKTKSRVLVFDPNSDFRKVAEVIAPKYWKEKAGYNQKDRRGFLPDEHTYEEFKQQWDDISKVVLSMKQETKHRRRLQIDWAGVSIDILSEDLDAAFESELRHCHDFVRTISDLSNITKTAEWRAQNDLLDVASDLCDVTRGGKEKQIVLQFRDRFNGDGIDENQDWEALRARLFMPRLVNKKNARERAADLHEKAALYRSFVSEKTERFYFSSAYAVREAGLLRAGKKDLPDLSDARLQVVDLPSISEPRFRLLAVSTLLAGQWRRSRREWESALARDAEKDPRVPTFIVVDEAHNLIPDEPRNHNEKRLREQFRTVAAEGRKFGLFLILVSQRPDKLDPLVLSECSNRAVMRVGSEAVLRKTKEALGLGDIATKTLERCLEFEVGRALIAGPWAPEGPTFLYGAFRRTEEGGRNLQAEHWATPATAGQNERTNGKDAATGVTKGPAATTAIDGNQSPSPSLNASAPK